MTDILTAWLVAAGASTALLAIAAFRAPVGWQDALGFHVGSQPLDDAEKDGAEGQGRGLNHWKETTRG